MCPFSLLSVELDVDLDCQKQLFQLLSERLEEKLGVSADKVISALRDREALGSTYLGQGVALPHGILQEIEGCHLIFCRPQNPIPCELDEGESVELAFCLLAGEGLGNQPAKILSKVSRLCRSSEMRKQLAAAQSHAVIADLLSSEPISQAA